MRHTRWNALVGRKARRVVLAGGLGFSLLRLGAATNNYYYGNPPRAPGCPPGTGTTIMPRR